MQKKILIAQNISHEGPGILGGILNKHHISFDIVNLEHQNFPELNNYQAIIILGGPNSANDTDDLMVEQIKKVEEVIRKDIPFLGICLGFQILVKAAGGTVTACPNKEIGLKDEKGNDFFIHLTSDGLNDPIFKNLDKQSRIFHLHGETVILNDKMRLLAEGNQCKNQIIKVGNSAYGIQGHFELNPEMLDVWLDEDSDLKETDRKKLCDDFITYYEESKIFSETLFTNFLSISGLYKHV